MFDQDAGTFGIAAAQLVEAAWHAMQGDGESAKARIQRAVALLGGELSAELGFLRSRGKPKQSVPRGGLTAWQVRRLTDQIDADLAATIHIDDLARLVGLSNGHFSREFKRTFGLSAHAYLMRRRVEVAQGLMLTTNAPLSAIALSCGMSDQSHFSRSFRRLVGETPDAWRRSRRDAIAWRAAGLAQGTAARAEISPMRTPT
jgi:AraC family transcriptional regulator